MKAIKIFTALEIITDKLQKYLVYFKIIINQLVNINDIHFMKIIF